MRPYYDRDGITIYCGDCRDILPTLEAGCVDLVLTDPPYGMDYVNRIQRGPNGTGKKGATKHRLSSVSGDREKFDPSPLLDYPKVILWGFQHFNDTLPPGSVLVWLKRYDDGFGSFLSDADLAWMKGGCGVYCKRDLSLQGVDRVHPTEKPVALMRWILEKWSKPGDLILDPYMGSGPVARACLDLGRRYIGIELSEAYCAVAVKRLQQQVLPLEVAHV